MTSSQKLAKSHGSHGGSNLPPNTAPVTRKFISRPDGTASTQLGIETSSLPPPERRYSADVAHVGFNGTDAVLVTFAQHTLVSTLRSLITLKLYSESARRLVESCASVQPILEQYVERHKLHVPDLAPLAGEPAHSVSLVASFAQTAFSGYEAEMAFFHVSPFAVHRASTTDVSYIYTEPVVQVDMSTGTLAAVLRKLRTITETLPGEEE